MVFPNYFQFLDLNFKPLCDVGFLISVYFYLLLAVNVSTWQPGPIRVASCGTLNMAFCVCVWGGGGGGEEEV